MQDRLHKWPSQWKMKVWDPLFKNRGEFPAGKSRAFRPDWVSPLQVLCPQSQLCSSISCDFHCFTSCLRFWSSSSSRVQHVKLGVNIFPSHDEPLSPSHPPRLVFPNCFISAHLVSYYGVRGPLSALSVEFHCSVVCLSWFGFGFHYFGQFSLLSNLLLLCTDLCSSYTVLE